MTRLSTTLTALLALWAVSAPAAERPTQPWPLKGTIDLSSGYGDLRANRFHAGLDLRTGGQIGAKVYSPVDGFVSRVRMSYRGYGKGLYVKGNDGYLYVFGHLNGFVPNIEKAVTRTQFRDQRYYVDLYFPKDSIPVKQGDLIAYSGQTGVGAPHLHFEKRSPNNVPLNPLTHGFALDDKTPPTFERVGFRLIGEGSLFPDNSRQLFFPVRKVKEGEYTLDTVLYLNTMFSLSADCYDQMRPGGMKQAVYDLNVTFDDLPGYDCTFDSLAYENSWMASLTYDAMEAANGDARVRALSYCSGGAEQALWFPRHGTFGGVTFGGYGKHRARIVATDVSGNRATLNLSFVWGFEQPLYRLDTATSTAYFVRPFGPVAFLNIDSVYAETFSNGNWRHLRGARVTTLDSGWLRVEQAPECRECPMRLVISSSDGATWNDLAFGKPNDRRPKVDLSYVVDSWGIGVIAEFSEPVSGTVSLVPGGGYVRIGLNAPVRDGFNDRYCDFGYWAALKPRDSLAVRVRYADGTLIEKIPLHVHEFSGAGDYSPDGTFTISATNGTWVSDDIQWIDVQKQDKGKTTGQTAASATYRVLPEAFPLKKAFTVSIKLDSNDARSAKAGLCWYDKSGDKWTWIDTTPNEPYVAAGPSLGGGMFAALIDDEPPTIQKLNLKSGHTYTNLQPTVECDIDDNLSGFEDDRDFDIRINGVWMLPQYDFETGKMIAALDKPLAPGKAVLTVSAVDRAGNKSERKVEFVVEKGSKKK